MNEADRMNMERVAGRLESQARVYRKAAEDNEASARIAEAEAAALRLALYEMKTAELLVQRERERATKYPTRDDVARATSGARDDD